MDNMDIQTILNAPQEEVKSNPTVVAKTTKIKALIDISTETKKTSKKLRKLFEKDIYQKKTQLSVLKRYKKRIDSIDKQEESKQKKLTAKKLSPKNSLPQFKSNFFSSGDDPLAALAQLAAFKAFMNFGSGNILQALGQTLLAGGLMAGPAMIGGAARGMFGGNAKPARGFDVTGRRASTSTQQRYLSRHGDKAFKNRFGKDALKRIQSSSEVASTATKGAKVGKAFGRFGAALIPGVGAAVGVADAALRAQSGDTTGSAIAGTAAALDAAAAASAVTGIGLPLAGLLSVASFALDATNLIRDLSGASAKEEEKNKQKVTPKDTKIQERLKEETQKQKEQSQVRGSTLSFKSTLVGYERAIKKFEKFSTLHTGTFDPSNPYNEPPPGPAPSAPPGGSYDGPVSGETFFPLPGGDIGTQGNVSASQRFGASRDGGTRPHAGLDMTHWSGPLNAPISAFKTGKVISAKSAGYNGSIEIDHGGGLATRYVHVIPSVSVGQVVYGGQQIGTLYPAGGNTHLHFEFYDGNTAKDPESVLRTVKNRITSPLSVDRAKEHANSSNSPGANRGLIVDGPKTGYYQLVHGKEAIIPIDNYHTRSGGDPLQNVPPNIINTIISKSKIYENAMANTPPTVVNVPVPMPPSSSPVMPMGGQASLNTSGDSDAMILRALMYKASA
jgi:murein DD-endopeptidase MepM/ murein hydrolase activator NlpD